MASRVPRGLLLSLLIPLGTIAVGFGVILLGIEFFSGGNLLGGLGPLGLLIQLIGVAGLVVVLVVWAAKLLIRPFAGRGKHRLIGERSPRWIR
jgi:hypothetical protein